MSTRTRKAIVTCGFFVIGLVFMLAWISACGELYDRGLLGKVEIAFAFAILFGGLFGLRRGFLAALPGEQDAEV